MVCECDSATSRSVRSLSLMVSAIRCSDAYNLHRLGVPAVDDLSEPRGGHATPDRSRHAGHLTDECAQHGAHLVIAGVDSACDRGHQPEVGVQ